MWFWRHKPRTLFSASAPYLKAENIRSLERQQAWHSLLGQSVVHCRLWRKYIARSKRSAYWVSEPENTRRHTIMIISHSSMHDFRGINYHIGDRRNYFRSVCDLLNQVSQTVTPHHQWSVCQTCQKLWNRRNAQTSVLNNERVIIIVIIIILLGPAETHLELYSFFR